MLWAAELGYPRIPGLEESIESKQSFANCLARRDFEVRDSTNCRETSGVNF